MNLTKKLLKKAFTLVELVVVVAVIAILSAVSVAAYVGITDRTKTEADRANVSEWNTLLKVETVEGTLNNVIEVQDYFNNQGFGDEDYIPRTNGYSYYYCLDNNTMYLVDDFEESFDVTYPEDTLGEVNKENSYRLNNTYCLLNSSIEGVTFSRNALVVGQDNEVGVSADPMPARVIINSTEYILSNGKITIHPDSSAQLTASESDTLLNATVTNPTAKTGLTYTGSAQALVTAGTTDGGTWQYKVGTGSYSATLPTATSAGTYTVYFKLDGGTNYHDIAEKSVSVTIAKATATTTAPAAKTGLTYSGSAQALVTGGSTNGGTWYYSLNNTSYSTTVPTGTNAGTYTVYYKLVGGTNYYDISVKNISVTIAKKSQSISSPTYESSNVTSSSVTLTAVSAGQGDTTYGYSITNSSSSVSNWQSSTSFTGLSASTTYYFFAKYAGNSNYNETISTATTITTSTDQVVTYKITVYNNSGVTLTPKSVATTINSGGDALLSYTYEYSGTSISFALTVVNADYISGGGGSSGSTTKSFVVNLFEPTGDVTVTINLKS